MSNPSADSPALPTPPGESWLPGPKPPDEDWTQKKIYSVLVFVLLLHVVLIFLFGTKNQIIPRTVANVPHLQLSDNADEFIALGDPTLFARPNTHDVVTTFWRRMPVVTQPDFNWKEAPRYLSPAPGDFGAAFREYLRNSQPAEFPLNVKPEPKLILPTVAFDARMPKGTTMQISGELVHRRLLHAVDLPLLPRNDVIAPSTVQVLVDTAGNVASAIPLKLNADNDTDNEADQTAVQLARQLRFAPAPALMFGEITYKWHTVALTSTNANR